jgi:general secretion pathway protein B
VSFILDALRKSEHERQRSTMPGLTQVPSATTNPEVPRWVLPVIGVLAAAVLVLGGAWWQSTRGADDATATAAPNTRTVELPRPTPQTGATVAPIAVVPPAAPPRVPLAEATRAPATSLSASAGTTLEAAAAPANAVGTPEELAAASEPTLPSAASLAAEGVSLPPLRLDLHAYSERRSDRFVFINGRKYVEGERLPEGLVLEAVEPRGAVLSHAGRRFLLVPE